MLEDSDKDYKSKHSQSFGYCLTPFQRKLLLKNLESGLRQDYVRRIEIMLRADRGQSQAEICSELGCTQETARYWIAMAQTGQAHKWQDCPVGRPKTISEEYITRLQELVSHSPRDYGYSFQRWTAQWLSKHLAKQLGIECSPRHINRLLKQMGLSTKPEKTEATAESAIPKDTSIVIHNLTPSREPIISDYLFVLR
jgi:putative transposase